MREGEMATYTTTYKWNQLSKRQQDTARRALPVLTEQGWGASVSRLAKHYDATAAFLSGRLAAADLADLVDAERLVKTVEMTAAQAAEALGVSRSTVYRRLRAGKLDGRKNAGRWTVTITQ